MERKIGEMFEYKGKTYEVVKEIYACNGCAFVKRSVCSTIPNYIKGYCSQVSRSDYKGVIFKKVTEECKNKKPMSVSDMRKEFVDACGEEEVSRMEEEVREQYNKALTKENEIKEAVKHEHEMYKKAEDMAKQSEADVPFPEIEEREVGSKFTDNYIMFRVIKEDNCKHCWFMKEGHCILEGNILTTGRCRNRKDGNSVSFLDITWLTPNQIQAIVDGKDLPYMLDVELMQKLDRIGLLPNDVRKDNVGRSNYSQHIIQPWSIILDWELDFFEGNILKYLLRTKKDIPREEDMDKIIHYAQEIKRQLKHKKE